MCSPHYFVHPGMVAPDREQLSRCHMARFNMAYAHMKLIVFIWQTQGLVSNYWGQTIAIELSHP